VLTLREPFADGLLAKAGATRIASTRNRRFKRPLGGGGKVGRGVWLSKLSKSRGRGGCREPGRSRRAAEAAVDQARWESGSERWCDGWETVWCEGPGARGSDGSDGVVPQGSQSWGAD
jgi:hypothetical protein